MPCAKRSQRPRAPARERLVQAPRQPIPARPVRGQLEISGCAVREPSSPPCCCRATRASKASRRGEAAHADHKNRVRPRTVAGRALGSRRASGSRATAQNGLRASGRAAAPRQIARIRFHFEPPVIQWMPRLRRCRCCWPARYAPAIFLIGDRRVFQQHIDAVVEYCCTTCVWFRAAPQILMRCNSEGLHDTIDRTAGSFRAPCGGAKTGSEAAGAGACCRSGFR